MMKGVDNELRIRGVTSNTYSKVQSIWRELKACISAPELVVCLMKDLTLTEMENLTRRVIVLGGGSKKKIIAAPPVPIFKEKPHNNKNEEDGNKGKKRPNRYGKSGGGVSVAPIFSSNGKG